MEVHQWYGAAGFQNDWALSGDARKHGKQAPSPIPAQHRLLATQAFVDNQTKLSQMYHNHYYEGLGHNENHQYQQSTNGHSPLSIDTSINAQFGAMMSQPAAAIVQPSYNLAHSQDTKTFDPSDMNLDPEEPSPTESFFHYDGFPREPKRPQKKRTDSSHELRHSQTSILSPTTSPTVDRQAPTRRRRRSEYAEPGSARAIYLEKNRLAASKCRNKQKRQEEELVLQARNVERQNKVLRAEVSILQDGMRELMDLIGQHSGCSDDRLRTYVQREADRWAAGERNSPSISIKSEPEPEPEPF